MAVYQPIARLLSHTCIYISIYIYMYTYIENRGSELIVPRNTCTCWKYYNREGRSVCSFSKLFSFMPTLRRGRGRREGRRSLTHVSRNGRGTRQVCTDRSFCPMLRYKFVPPSLFRIFFSPATDGGSWGCRFIGIKFARVENESCIGKRCREEKKKRDGGGF